MPIDRAPLVAGGIRLALSVSFLVDHLPANRLCGEPDDPGPSARLLLRSMGYRDALIGGTRRRDARLVPGVPGFRAPPIPPRPSDSARSCDGAEVSSRALARMRLAGTLITWN